MWARCYLKYKAEERAVRLKILEKLKDRVDMVIDLE
jgi:hypothetical protein